MVREITESRLLLVEGRDEEFFFSAFVNHLDISGIQIIPAGGVRQFPRELKGIRASENFDDRVTAIGVVRDSDANPEGAFDSVCSALRSASLPVPASIMTFSENLPRTAILIMPPREVGTNRTLEDLCLASVVDDSAITCLEAYFACLSEQEITFEDNDLAKARLHAFLASREVPDLRLGEAAQKGYWPWDHPAFNEVKTFLRQLAEA